jgi:hypothetical protein
MGVNKQEKNGREDRKYDDGRKTGACTICRLCKADDLGDKRSRTERKSPYARDAVLQRAREYHVTPNASATALNNQLRI